MVKNKYKSYQNYASSLRDYFLKTNKSICIFVKDTNEAMYLKNELQLILDIKQISLFPENEILPYDHSLLRRLLENYNHQYTLYGKAQALEY